MRKTVLPAEELIEKRFSGQPPENFKRNRNWTPVQRLERRHGPVRPAASEASLVRLTKYQLEFSSRMSAWRPRVAGREYYPAQQPRLRSHGSLPFVEASARYIRVQFSAPSLVLEERSTNPTSPAACGQRVCCSLRATLRPQRFMRRASPTLALRPRHLFSFPGEARRTGTRHRPSARARQHR